MRKGGRDGLHLFRDMGLLCMQIDLITCLTLGTMAMKAPTN